MTSDLEALARRAVACKGWRWFPGMRYRLHPTHPWYRFVGDIHDDDGNPCEETPPTRQCSRALPDLSDTITALCLLALVREAWGDPRIVAVPMSGRWFIVGVPSGEVFFGATEAEALISALEAAP